MNPLNTASLAKPLRADPLADRGGAAASGTAPVTFAGLLGEQQGRWSMPGGGSTAYDGSAFDVAPAPQPGARAAVPPTPPARAVEAPAPSNAERTAARPPSASTQNKAPQKSPEARREADPSSRAEPGRGDDAAASAPPAGATASARAGTDAATEAAPTEAQALIEWMARWSAPAGGGSAASAGLSPAAGADAARAGADAAASAAALQGAAAVDAAMTAADEAAVGADTAADAGGLAPAAALAKPAGSDFAASLASAQGTGASSAPAGAAGPTLALATPVDSPDFSKALASQLTTLARQGVHEAQLQLNPADMGPISVQITLDGSQAQVDFAAAHARTRDALEAAWPALAASLHGAGLTLGGGGVSDQRAGERDGGGNAPGADSRGRAEAGDDAAAAAPRSVRVDAHRGLLDLYA